MNDVARRWLLRLDIDWPYTAAVCAAAAFCTSFAYYSSGAFVAVLVCFAFVAFSAPKPRFLRKTDIGSTVVSSEVTVVQVTARLFKQTDDAQLRAVYGMLTLTAHRLVFTGLSIPVSIKLHDITAMNYRRALFGKVSVMQVRTSADRWHFEVRNPRLLLEELVSRCGAGAVKGNRANRTWRRK